jgi:phosphoenolpyruvate carboxykinase (GTP)
MTTTFKELQDWVDHVAKLTKPDAIHWCDGSKEESNRLVNLMLETGALIRLNEKTYPGCFLHRSDPSDVARTEHLTFVCTTNREDAGPNNNWMDPNDAKTKMRQLFDGCMKGRTMYVIPYCMGPIGSPFARVGVEITDSPYVVENMRTMTRMGKAALERIERDRVFVKGLHSTGDLNPDRRFVMHFPETLTIMSIGSGYGGNALLGKKCHALRIASWQGRQEGWLAEHMLILGIENPQGQVNYVAAAFPSACGKTNLAMLIPPDQFKGYKVWTIGDDIAWIHVGDDGRFWAINPEAGYFGVAPGTSAKTNPNALNMLNRDTIFTNVAVDGDNQPWWEGKSDAKPVTDWKGNAFNPTNGPAAHPNSRFTVSARQCASYSPRAEEAAGVPLSAIIFGGRRAEVAPLVFESFDWEHGVLVGASMASETTAAATGQVGVVRRDPMAMKPFCGYDFGSYWQHWLEMGSKAKNPPHIFHVNWFRQDQGGRFMWPGFGDNLRVLNWIIARCQNATQGQKTAIGIIPKKEELDFSGLNINPETVDALLHVSGEQWRKELQETKEYFETFGDRFPKSLWKRHGQIATALQN